MGFPFVTAKQILKKLGGNKLPGKVLFDVPLAIDEDGFATAALADLPENKLIVGKTYKVTTDGGTFTSVCRLADEVFYVVGNPALYGGEDSGESFSVAMVLDGETWSCIVTDFAAGTHMTVATTETIHPIDPKYLPEGFGGGGLKEISTADHGFTILGSEDPTTVVYPESFVAELNAIAESGVPFILHDDLGTSGELVISVCFTGSTNQFLNEGAPSYNFFGLCILFGACMILGLNVSGGTCQAMTIPLSVAQG